MSPAHPTNGRCGTADGAHALLRLVTQHGRLSPGLAPPISGPIVTCELHTHARATPPPATRPPATPPPATPPPRYSTPFTPIVTCTPTLTLTSAQVRAGPTAPDTASILRRGQGQVEGKLTPTQTLTPTPTLTPTLTLTLTLTQPHASAKDDLIATS